MANVQKFLFDRTFDAEPMVPVVETPPDNDDMAVEELEAPPTFTEEDVEAARTEGFARGREEALGESLNAAETRAADALSVIGERLSEVFRTQELANAETTRGAIVVAAAIARKMFPDLDRRNRLGEVETIVRTSMERTMAAPRLVIHVNESLTDDLSARIATLRSETGFEGEVIVAGDPKLRDGDCRIEWKDGGAERDIDALWQEIDEIIEYNLGTDEPELGKATEMPAPDEGSSETGAEIATGAGVPDDAADAIVQASPVEPAPQVPEPAQGDRDQPETEAEPAVEASGPTEEASETAVAQEQAPDVPIVDESDAAPVDGERIEGEASGEVVGEEADSDRAVTDPDAAPADGERIEGETSGEVVGEEADSDRAVTDPDAADRRPGNDGDDHG